MERHNSAAAQRASTSFDLSQAPWPHFAEDEIDASVSVLRSGKVNYWTGKENDQFEKEFATYFEAPYAIAAGNGTLALDLALLALGLSSGDEVVVTPRSYFASVSSVVLAGATPIFADIDRDSQNLTAQSIERVLTPRTKAIMPVHLAGWPCDMPAIMALAKAHELAVIEDCAQAHGARIACRSVGSFGDAAGFSFCQDKIMTTGGEGGMFLTNREDLWDAAWSFKDHGKRHATVHRKDHPPGFRWLHESFGSNFRLTEMQAAIGRVQLGKLNSWVDTRRAHASIFVDEFSGLGALRTPLPGADCRHAYYKFYTFVRPEALRSGWDRDRIMAAVVDAGVPCFSGSCPEIYREKALVDRGLSPSARLPVARELGETSLMFLVHPTLEAAQVRHMAIVAARVVAEATR
ncbi:MAG: DegT/DnrJ/EryC1/StrS family aminotransferase [Gammaproteobacteria bacterium]